MTQIQNFVKNHKLELGVALLLGLLLGCTLDKGSIGVVVRLILNWIGLLPTSSSSIISCAACGLLFSAPIRTKPWTPREQIVFERTLIADFCLRVWITAYSAGRGFTQFASRELIDSLKARLEKDTKEQIRVLQNMNYTAKIIRQYVLSRVRDSAKCIFNEVFCSKTSSSIVDEAMHMHG